MSTTPTTTVGDSLIGDPTAKSDDRTHLTTEKITESDTLTAADTTTSGIDDTTTSGIDDTATSEKTKCQEKISNEMQCPACKCEIDRNQSTEKIKEVSDSAATYRQHTVLK